MDHHPGQPHKTEAELRPLRPDTVDERQLTTTGDTTVRRAPISTKRVRTGVSKPAFAAPFAAGHECASALAIFLRTR
jgi:hypothetical protein